MKLHDPGNTKHITELFAYLSSDSGGEGIAGAVINGMGLQLVTASETIARGAFADAAAHIEKMSGKKVRMVRFRRIDD